MKKITFLLLVSPFFLEISTAFAQDRVFAYTYQSNVLNKGQKELEVWNTLRSGREDFYRGIDNRAEFEIGLGSRVQTAFYLNFTNATFFDANSQQIITVPAKIGFSNEWKWKLLDPVADPIGLALYGEIGISPDEADLEIKLILDKQLGRTLHAINLVAEPEWEPELKGNGEVEQEMELVLEADYGFSVNLSPHWRAGLEARILNESQHDITPRTTIFAGPGISYNTNGFWANFVLMPQVAGTSLEKDIRDLTHHERLEARLIFSIAF